jgi:hypothetical protein
MVLGGNMKLTKDPECQDGRMGRISKVQVALVDAKKKKGKND